FDLAALAINALAIDARAIDARRWWWLRRGRRGIRRLGVGRRAALGAGCCVRVAVAADRYVGLETGGATGVIAVGIVAQVRVGLVGRASATAATRWASTF